MARERVHRHVPWTGNFRSGCESALTIERFQGAFLWIAMEDVTLDVRLASGDPVFWLGDCRPAPGRDARLAGVLLRDINRVPGPGGLFFPVDFFAAFVAFLSFQRKGGDRAGLQALQADRFAGVFAVAVAAVVDPLDGGVDF